MPKKAGAMLQRKGKGNPDTSAILSAIVLLALVGRLYFLKIGGAEPNPDSYNIAEIARNISQGRFFLEGSWGSIIWPTIQPLFPFLVALLTFFTHDLFLSGRLISLFSGVATVPLVYFLWRRLESEEIALLAAFLVGMNWVIWSTSLHVFRDTLFLFFSVGSLLLLYKSREAPRSLPMLGLFLGMATLTREEGYILALSSALAYSYWKLEDRRWDDIPNTCLASVLFLFPVLSWNYFRYIKTGTLVPYFLSMEVGTQGRVGLNWIPSIASSLTVPLFLLALLGIVLIRSRWEEYLPLYLFAILYSLAHMWFVNPSERYVIPLMPLFFGWASIATVSICNRFFHQKEVRAVLLVFSLLLFGFSAHSVSQQENRPNSYEVIRESMEWFNSNSEEGSSLIAGEDHYVYSYFTDRRVIGYQDYFNAMAEADRLGVREPLISFLISEGVQYVVVRDSLHPWVYRDIQVLMRKFGTQERIIDYNRVEFNPPIEKLAEGKIFTRDFYTPTKVSVRFEPLRKFSRNGQVVELYRLHWLAIQ